MILEHLKPTKDNKCPICSADLKHKDYLLDCSNCPYFQYEDFYCLFAIGKYNITVFYQTDRLIISETGSIKNLIDSTQKDFVNLDWKRPDIEQRLDLLLFYH